MFQSNLINTIILSLQRKDDIDETCSHQQLDAPARIASSSSQHVVDGVPDHIPGYLILKGGSNPIIPRGPDQLRGHVEGKLRRESYRAQYPRGILQQRPQGPQRGVDGLQYQILYAALRPIFHLIGIDVVVQRIDREIPSPCILDGRCHAGCDGNAAILVVSFVSQTAEVDLETGDSQACSFEVFCLCPLATTGTLLYPNTIHRSLLMSLF
mmetsp:Transcript_13104/g.31878  ORF Transcript_13104/g.31878 Transcript_13104/m.31878 type:complete len:211 (+) Transcript_13104:770-1402(+)